MLLSSLPLPLASVTDTASACALLFALIIGHAFADFPLQGEFIALGKNRNTPSPKLGDGNEAPKHLWIYLMSAHALIHAGFVWLITGSAILALAEFVLHWIIDVAKCEGSTSFALDQWLHVLTKVIFVIILMLGWIS